MKQREQGRVEGEEGERKEKLKKEEEVKEGRQ